MYRVYEYTEAIEKPYKHIQINRMNGYVPAERKRGTANSEERFLQSVSRSRSLVKDYGICNSWDLFITCTFSPDKVDRNDYSSVSKSLRKFFNNFRDRVAPNFRYMIIPERHKNGAWHFHGLVRGIPASEFYEPATIRRKMPNGRYKEVPNTPHYVSWQRYEKRFGFFNCSAIKNPVACAIYVSKYITKDLISFSFGKQVVLCSKGLAKPIMVFDGEGYIDGKADFENEFCAVKYDTSVIHDRLMHTWFYIDDEPIEKIEHEAIEDGFLVSQLSLL